jgi:hypothetical protein
VNAFGIAVPHRAIVACDLAKAGQANRDKASATVACRAIATGSAKAGASSALSSSA